MKCSSSLQGLIQGRFRWVSCQIDHICALSNDRSRRKALDTLPPDLPTTYERVLERVNASDEENQIIVQRTLRWILVGVLHTTILYTIYLSWVRNNLWTLFRPQCCLRIQMTVSKWQSLIVWIILSGPSIHYPLPPYLKLYRSASMIGRSNGMQSLIPRLSCIGVEVL